MPWQPLPRIAFAVATYPFPASSPADLPLEIGDELYIIEETPDGNWLRGYLVAPPSLLAGLTSVKGQTLEARVFSGIFPRSCVEVREMLGESDHGDGDSQDLASDGAGDAGSASDSAKSGITNVIESTKGHGPHARSPKGRRPWIDLPNGTFGNLSLPVARDPALPRPAAPVPMLKIGDETPTSADEPLVDEIASCLREWHSKNLHELLLSRQYAKLDELSRLVTSLNLHRQQFLHNVLTSNEYEQLREKTVWDLVRVNKLCGSEVIVRDPMTRGRVLTGDDSVIDVTNLQSVMSLLEEPPLPTLESTTLNHLLMEVKGFAGASTEETSLVIYLVSKPQFGQATSLSEYFSIDIPAGGSINGLAQSAGTRTLFTDLSAQDIGDVPSVDSELYLVVKVLGSQQIVMPRPLSRSGSNDITKDKPRSPTVGAGKSSRRSLMWGSKSARSAFRGNGVIKMDSVAEQQEKENRPSTSRLDSQDSSCPRPPSTAGSRSQSGASIEASTQGVQRTMGVGVLRLNSMMRQDDEVEQMVNIWSPTPRFPIDRDENEFDNLVRDIMTSNSGHFERSRGGERMQVSLRKFSHPDADDLIKATPTILSGVSQTTRIGFSGAPTKPRSDIYLTLNTAALARSHLLSRYGGSATSMPNTLHATNLQVTLEVRRNSGERFERCIFASSNSEALTTFKSAVTERGEAWNQTLRLCLSPEDVANAHVAMFLSDMPNPPFAVAHMPLWEEKAFICDGSHGLLLYKIDEFTSTPLPGPSGKGGYLSVPWTPRGKDERSAEVTGPLAVVLVDTFLCSTRFSQDRVILGVLRWKELPKEDVPTVLRQLIFVPEIEVVKLLSDVLDGLFGILVEYSGSDELEDLVFSAIVRVLGIVHDRRFNLSPLVDQYAETQFNYPFATPCLIRSFTRLLKKPTEPETARGLRATFKVVRHILKFITQSRNQRKLKEAGIGITSNAQGFTRSLRSIFKALDEMMRNTAPVLIGNQTLAVQHFHTWLPELTGLLSTEEILHIAIDFMDSCIDVRGKLILYKLILIINYSKLDLFAHPDQRSALSANTVRWISPHWGHTEDVTDQWREQVRLCCSVLSSQIDFLGAEIPDHIPNIVDSYLSILSSPKRPSSKLSLLFPSSYPFPTKTTAVESSFDEALAELSAVLSAVSNSPSGLQLELADNDLTSLLENMLRVQMSILVGEAFPSGWLSIHIYHHKSTMRILQYLATIMLDSFLPDPEEAETFNTELWKLFFTTLLKLVGSSSLALETFPEQKRRAVWKIAGDVREHGAELLRRTWEAIGWETSFDERNRYGVSKIGGYQVQYVPTLVGPIVELCLSVHEGLRRMAVEVLQTMIVSEWTLSEDLSVVQMEMIDSLDNYFKSNPLTESSLQKLFVSEVLERFQPLSEVPDDPLYAALRDLVGTVDEFLDLLVAVHSGQGDGEATNIINRLRLMEFLRDMQKEEIFVRYVHQLANLQAESRNHTEAGLALRLHADLYEWDPIGTTPALIDPEFPTQSPFERKERIYFDMIKHFEDGESWSNALTTYKELKAQYESNTFDFAKLARTERAIATIYEKISKTEKIVPRYFRVVFKGLGFPASVRDKKFVYEGLPNERASAFTDRMQEQYPSAQVITAGDVDELEGQFLVISAITPHRDLSHQVFQRARVPQVIRDFLVSSHPQVFSVTTKRNTAGPVREHHAEKKLFTTSEPFPTILRRSEIVECYDLRLSAHETALERIVRKTQEMTTLERRLADGEEHVAQQLMDAVTISVNPASDNSVSKYRKLLPEPPAPKEYEDGEEDVELELEEEPELEPQDTAIKMALVDHAIMIKRCLTIFARSPIEKISRRHQELHGYFKMTFAPEIIHFAPTQLAVREPVSTPSTTWRGSMALNDRGQQWSGIAIPLSGVKAEEAAIIRQVQPRQRAARLSFLGNRKKELDDGSDPATPVNGRSDSVHTLSPGGQDNNPLVIQKLLRTASMESSRNDAPFDERTVTSAGRESTDTLSREDVTIDKEAPKMGSVRKRFSLLKLGMKTTKSNTMISVDEE